MIPGGNERSDCGHQLPNAGSVRRSHIESKKLPFSSIKALQVVPEYKCSDPDINCRYELKPAKFRSEVFIPGLGDFHR